MRLVFADSRSGPPTITSLHGVPWLLQGEDLSLAYRFGTCERVRTAHGPWNVTTIYREKNSRRLNTSRVHVLSMSVAVPLSQYISAQVVLKAFERPGCVQADVLILSIRMITHQRNHPVVFHLLLPIVYLNYVNGSYGREEFNARKYAAVDGCILLASSTLMATKEPCTWFLRVVGLAGLACLL